MPTPYLRVTAVDVRLPLPYCKPQMMTIVGTATVREGPITAVDVRQLTAVVGSTAMGVNLAVNFDN